MTMYVLGYVFRCHMHHPEALAILNYFSFLDVICAYFYKKKLRTYFKIIFPSQTDLCYTILLLSTYTYNLKFIWYTFPVYYYYYYCCCVVTIKF